MGAFNSPQYDPRFENGPDSGMRLQESTRPQPKKGKKTKEVEQPASRNPHPESVQLNKNSGSDEALNPNGAAEPISAEVDEMYGYEYGDEDYGEQQQDKEQPLAEQAEQAPPEESPPKGPEVKPAAKKPEAEAAVVEPEAAEQTAQE